MKLDLTLKRRRRKRARRAEPGAHPGQFRVDPEAPPAEVSLIAYGPEALEEATIATAAEIGPYRDRHPTVWVDIRGLGGEQLLLEIAERFDLHNLALEDVAHGDQRPKHEVYGDQLFLVLQSAHFLDGAIHRSQLSLFAGEGFVVTFREQAGFDLEPVKERLRSAAGFDFEPVKERLRDGRPRLRTGGAGYLTYALLDAAIDQYFPVLESFQEHLEGLEIELRTDDEDALHRIEEARSGVFELRRAIQPVRDVTRSLISTDSPLIGDRVRVFLRDVHDHALEAAEMLEICREIAGGLIDVHLSTVSHKANETMKVLTVIATIFMPLSFIAGLYGMNFDTALPGNMPELGWPYGYVGALGAMALVALGLLLYFRRKGWF